MDGEPCPSGPGQRCSVCEALRKPCICPHCCRKLLASDRRVLHALQTRRGELAEQLDEAVRAQEPEARWRAELEQRRRTRDKVAQQACAVEAQVLQVRAEADALRGRLAGQRSGLGSASSDLSAWRREALGHRLPDVLRARELEHGLAAERLRREQHRRMRQLLQILPLTIPALRSRPSPTLQQQQQQYGLQPDVLRQPSQQQQQDPAAAAAAPAPAIPCVAVCGLRLPELGDKLQEDTEHAQEWAAALAYAALFVQMAAGYLGAPVLHHLEYQGSTSHVWAPRRFSCRSLPGTTGRLPLFPPAQGSSTTAAASPAASGSSSSAGGSGVGALQRPSSVGGGGATPGLARTRRSARAREFHAALVLLQRSVAALVGACYRHNSAKLPADWPPFAWLAGMCDQISRADEGAAALLGPGLSPACSMELPDGAPLLGPDAVVVEYGSYHLDGSDEGSGGGARGGGAGEDDGDEWDVVQPPSLPPPPSQPEEVEHWARAMFTDNNSSGGAAGTGAGWSGGSGSSGHGTLRRALLLQQPRAASGYAANLISRGVAGAQQQLPEAAAAVQSAVTQQLRQLRRLYSAPARD